jgi:histidyl-tRNA synthetase
LLARLAVPFAHDPRLVRGLDYYTRTAFEIHIPGHEGAQNAVGGGGRYDLLVEMMGGRPTPAIGFAIGVERLLALVESQRPAATAPSPSPVAARARVYVAWLGGEGRARALVVASQLRAAGVPALVDPAGAGFGKQLKAANRAGARLVILIGEDEVAGGSVSIKDLASRDQVRIAAADALAHIRRVLESPGG